MNQVELVSVADLLKELSEDTGLPKNIKERIADILDILSEEKDVSLKVNKAIHEIEKVVDDRNLQAYTRTQLFNIISALESV